MKNRKSRLTAFQKMYMNSALLVLLTVLVTGAASLYFAISIKQQDLDTAIRDLASLTANLEVVRRDLADGAPSPELDQELRLLIESFEQVDVLVVCDVNGIRYFHNEKERVGQHFVGNDEAPILSGADPYISEAVGTLGMQRRAFHAVTDEEGTIVGFVIASVLTSHLIVVRNRIIGTFLLLLAVMIPVGCLFSYVWMIRLKKLLMGFAPEEFLNLYIERREVLDALEEGIFAVNTQGNVILMNQSARRMLNMDPDEITEGRPLKQIFPETRLPETVRTGKAEYNISFSIYQKNVISSRIPIRQKDQIIGAVSIFRDRTEVTKLAEELTGANYMVDTLRAFNHEFMNKLHIILGLLEINETEKAKHYILQTSLVSGEAVSDISHRVPISTLAALLIGKLIRANELGISFSLKKDSYFFSKETHLPADCYITLVGNLVENAMDELNSADYPVKSIELGIYSEEAHTIITCDDTGGGIPEEILFSIYDRHTTTKGEGHGTGFALMKEIVDRYEGTFHIDTEPGVGTSIEIILPV